MSTQEEESVGLLLDGAKDVARRLKQRGFEAYFAGGCVRDRLLGTVPKDYDLVTNARPEEVSAVFRRTVQVGAAFGVVIVLIGDREYEVATYRADGTYSDGRRPDAVTYSQSKIEDVERRDFTINALLMDPETEEVLDFVGGRADLLARVVRAVGEPEKRFSEDRLRILRAIRFAAQLGFEIEPKTLAAIPKYVHDLHKVSVERVVQELFAMWASTQPDRAFRLLAGSGALEQILPFLGQPASQEDLAAAELGLSRLPDVARDLKGAERALLAFAILVGHARPPFPDRRSLERCLRELKLSKDHARRVLDLVDQRLRLLKPQSTRSGECVALAMRHDFSILLAFLEALEGREAQSVRSWRERSAELMRNPLPAGPLLTGADLLGRGLTPGPSFKQLLAAAELEVFERQIKTREEALAWLDRQIVARDTT